MHGGNKRKFDTYRATRYREAAVFPISCVQNLCTGDKLQMTPTVFIKNGYRFFFFAREESRMHVHVVSGDGEAKFWLEPDIELAKNYRYTRKNLKEIESLVEEYADEIISAWRNHFEG